MTDQDYFKDQTDDQLLAFLKKCQYRMKIDANHIQGQINQMYGLIQELQDRREKNVCTNHSDAGRSPRGPKVESVDLHSESTDSNWPGDGWRLHLP